MNQGVVVEREWVRRLIHAHIEDLAEDEYYGRKALRDGESSGAES